MHTITLEDISPAMDTAIHLHADNVKLREDNKKLRAGIKAVRELMSESTGVAGLHMNGEIAEWDCLEMGGKFEGWLIAFTEAESV